MSEAPEIASVSASTLGGLVRACCKFAREHPDYEPYGRVEEFSPSLWSQKTHWRQAFRRNVKELIK